MSESKKYIFFLDIDGTLIDGEFISADNIAAIDQARRDGHLVFINTGRSLAFIPKWIEEKMEFDGIVAGSGSYIRIGSNVIKCEVLPFDTLLKTCKFYKNGKRRCLFEGVDDLFVINPDAVARPYSAITLSSDTEFAEKYSNARVSKVHLNGVLTFAEKRYLSMFYNVLQQNTYAECSIVGCDKGKALEEVMEHYPEYISVAIGDSTNDIEMLAVSDISVAMGNAPDAIKHICTYETASCRDGGVGRAINMLINHGKI